MGFGPVENPCATRREFPPVCAVGTGDEGFCDIWTWYLSVDLVFASCSIGTEQQLAVAGPPARQIVAIVAGYLRELFEPSAMVF